MKEMNKLSEYARLCIEVGVNVQKNQCVMINAPVETMEFTRLLVEHAYKAGARDVFVRWSDGITARLKYQYAPKEEFETVPEFIKACLDYYLDRDTCYISVSADDPELLKGLDSDKIQASLKSQAKALLRWRRTLMNDESCWLVVSVPTDKWAKKVFPDSKNPMEDLWSAIFDATRMETEDPVEAWKKHLGFLSERVKYMNEMNFKYLHYTSSNGTDLHIELPEGHIWAGGGAYSMKGTFFVANIPTEEVFTLPKRDGVNGTVYSVKPLVYNGRLIDEFRLTFKDGEVVDYDAKVGKDILKELLELDEGSKRLGEVALVPHDSPISNSNILFYNTLFDENASCHLALGRAYPTNIKDGVTMNEEELKAHGVNDSMTHNDFMIGAEDLHIVGEKSDGTKVDVFVNGNWA